MDEFYENLADAIIVQAAKDYRYVLTRLKYHPHDRRWQIARDRLEHFFKSEWFYIYIIARSKLVLPINEA